MGFWGTFNGFKRSTRVVLITSFILGLSTLVAGILIDVRTQLFENLSYIPNIWAGFTGFLIGAPFALIVLATYTVQREESVARKRVSKLSDQAWLRFRDAVYKLCSDERLSALEESTGRVVAIHNRLYVRYQIYLQMGRRKLVSAEGGPTSEETQAFQTQLEQLHPLFMDAINEVFNKVGNDQIIQIVWYEIKNRWSVLDQYVRLQRMERDLPWFDARPDAEISNRMSPNTNPLTEFFAVNHTRNRLPNDSMLQAQAAVLHDSELSKEELDNKLIGAGYLTAFGHTRVDDYYTSALRAKDRLSSLRQIVEDVDKSSWPYDDD